MDVTVVLLLASAVVCCELSAWQLPLPCRQAGLFLSGCLQALFFLFVLHHNDVSVCGFFFFFLIQIEILWASWLVFYQFWKILSYYIFTYLPLPHSLSFYDSDNMLKLLYPPCLLICFLFSNSFSVLDFGNFFRIMTKFGKEPNRTSRNENYNNRIFKSNRCI